MKVAAITITYNDDYKFAEWCEHYQEYRDELYLHIIVDNHSGEEYADKVRTFFTHSKIIRRSSNGGCTYAYNDGIRLALADKEVDAIMLIGNDIRLEKGAVTNLYKFLCSNDAYGMVEPVILAKDSDIIEDFGCNISRTLVMRPFGCGEPLSAVSESSRTVEAVTGGMNLSKREFYENVGLQDECLFMYSDEVDMGIRAAAKGYKMAVTSEVVAWHQHINPGGRMSRLPYTSYLMGRNKVYLAKKHFGFRRSLEQLLFHVFLFFKGVVRNIFDKEKLTHHFYFIRGSFCGLTGHMGLVKVVKDFKTDENHTELR